MQQQIDALEARHGDDFPAQVRSLLQSALMTGDASADMLGYADASAFTRAFRRWSGTTPARWRMQRIARRRRPR
ncbi:MAG: helix-turn-helix domain-containing protein [Burkholderiales bacterium]